MVEFAFFLHAATRLARGIFRNLSAFLAIALSFQALAKVVDLVIVTSEEDIIHSNVRRLILHHLK